MDMDYLDITCMLHKWTWTYGHYRYRKLDFVMWPEIEKGIYLIRLCWKWFVQFVCKLHSMWIWKSGKIYGRLHLKEGTSASLFGFLCTQTWIRSVISSRQCTTETATLTTKSNNLIAKENSSFKWILRELPWVCDRELLLKWRGLVEMSML